MSDIKIAIVQHDTLWHDIQGNLNKLEENFIDLDDCDLIVLPEMFTTGFTMEPSLVAEPMNFHTTKWLKMMAQRFQCHILGSIVVKEKNLYYNRLLCISPTGEIEFYDKRHLFRMANEHEVYSAGNKKIIIKIKDWNICPQICYDLRFPIWSRNKNNEYDLLLFVANWPAKRREHWMTLLKARAIENLSYSLGVNRVGKDGNGLDYCGDSMLCFPDHREPVHFGNDERIFVISLNKEELEDYRKRFPAHLDSDIF